MLTTAATNARIWSVPLIPGPAMGGRDTIGARGAAAETGRCAGPAAAVAGPAVGAAGTAVAAEGAGV